MPIKTDLLLHALVLPSPLRVKDEIACGESLLLALALELRHVVRRHARLELLPVVEPRLKELQALRRCCMHGGRLQHANEVRRFPASKENSIHYCMDKNQRLALDLQVLCMANLAWNEPNVVHLLCFLSPHPYTTVPYHQKRRQHDDLVQPSERDAACLV